MNDLAPSPRDRTPARRRTVFAGLVALGLVGYAVLLILHLSPHAGGSDSSGYLNNARILSQGKLRIPPRTLPGHSADEFGPFLVVPLGFTLRSDGQMSPTYPVGYSLQLLAGTALGWSHATAVVNLLTAIASGGLLFAFCRKFGFAPPLAFGGVALLWLCPLFVLSALQPMSDLSALFWSLAALYSALEARENWKWSLGCGVAVGIAVLVRPTNLLLAFPVIIALGFRPWSWAVVALGGFPAAAFSAFYNWRVYGSPWTTGYGDVSTSFRFANLSPNLAHFAHWIPLLLSPLILLAFAAPFVSAGRQRGVAVLAAWSCVLIGFYAFYFHSGENWSYLRFILPAFPALILIALTVPQSICSTTKSRATWATILTVLFLAAAGEEWLQLRKLEVLHIERNERTYPDAARWAHENIPPPSAIFCMQVSGAFFQYTDFLLFRWDSISPQKSLPLRKAIAEQNRPVYAALFDFEAPAALERIGGHWTKLSTVGQVTFWQLQPE